MAWDTVAIYTRADPMLFADSAPVPSSRFASETSLAARLYRAHLRFARVQAPCCLWAQCRCLQADWHLNPCRLPDGKARARCLLAYRAHAACGLPDGMGHACDLHTCKSHTVFTGSVPVPPSPLASEPLQAATRLRCRWLLAKRAATCRLRI